VERSIIERGALKVPGLVVGRGVLDIPLVEVSFGSTTFHLGTNERAPNKSGLSLK